MLERRDDPVRIRIVSALRHGGWMAVIGWSGWCRMFPLERRRRRRRKREWVGWIVWPCLIRINILQPISFLCGCTDGLDGSGGMDQVGWIRFCFYPLAHYWI